MIQQNLKLKLLSIKGDLDFSPFPLPALPAPFLDVPTWENNKPNGPSENYRVSIQNTCRRSQTTYNLYKKVSLYRYLIIYEAMLTHHMVPAPNQIMKPFIHKNQ